MYCTAKPGLVFFLIILNENSGRRLERRRKRQRRRKGRDVEDKKRHQLEINTIHKVL